MILQGDDLLDFSAHMVLGEFDIRHGLSAGEIIAFPRHPFDVVNAHLALVGADGDAVGVFEGRDGVDFHLFLTLVRFDLVDCLRIGRDVHVYLFGIEDSKCAIVAPTYQERVCYFLQGCHDVLMLKYFGHQSPFGSG